LRLGLKLARRWVWAAMAVLVPAVGLWLGGGYALDAAAGSLVHRGAIQPSRAIVIENFDSDYLLFERASELLREGWAERVVVHAQEARGGGRAGAVSAGIVEVMARVARITEFEIVPIREIEPISLNAAFQVRDYLQREKIDSVIVVSPGFRSRRSYLVWTSVLEPAGIRVCLVPVFGGKTPGNWRETWHGWQEVSLQFLKLAYYRVAVL
jgi:hypothetical protein